MVVWRNMMRGYRNRAKSGEGIMKAPPYRLFVDDNFMITYRYELDGDTSFKFHLLSEVGEPFKPWFVEEIKKRGYRVVTRNLDHEPWIADFIV